MQFSYKKFIIYIKQNLKYSQFFLFWVTNFLYVKLIFAKYQINKCEEHIKCNKTPYLLTFIMKIHRVDMFSYLTHMHTHVHTYIHISDEIFEGCFVGNRYFSSFYVVLFRLFFGIFRRELLKRGLVQRLLGQTHIRYTPALFKT